jgi:hypothetical protein
MGIWLRKASSCGRAERMVAVLQAVFFDLYETLITECDPHWTPSPSTADQLGIDAGLFERSAHTHTALVAAQRRSNGRGIALRSAGGASEAGPR